MFMCDTERLWNVSVSVFLFNVGEQKYVTPSLSEKLIGERGFERFRRFSEVLQLPSCSEEEERVR